MKTRTWFDTAPGMVLSRAALCVLVLFSSGCLQHSIPIGIGYRINDKSGVPMLVPIAVESFSSERFQTVTVTLPASRSDAKKPVRDDCPIRGSIFSLIPGSGSDRRSWVVRSPSISGWDPLGGEMDVYEQWNIFVRELARIHDHGCFPSGVSTQFVRSAIAEKIPLPANEVPIFMFSDHGDRFVNLSPGMEIRIQKVLSTGASVDSRSTEPLRILTVVYDVVSWHGEGIRLKLSRGPDGGQKTSPGTQDRQLLVLDHRFAPTSVLRLWLQGFLKGGSQSDAILIGTSDGAQLDVLTDLIRQGNTLTCISRPGVVCIDLPPGSVSLFSIIWVNGRHTSCPFGTSLASLLFLLPPPKQARALESVQVIRQLSLGRYAGIQFTRTVEGARQLLLLPGDRIEWNRN